MGRRPAEGLRRVKRLGIVSDIFMTIRGPVTDMNAASEHGHVLRTDG